MMSVGREGQPMGQGRRLPAHGRLDRCAEQEQADHELQRPRQLTVRMTTAAAAVSNSMEYVHVVA